MKKMGTGFLSGTRSNVFKLKNSRISLDIRKDGVLWGGFLLVFVSFCFFLSNEGGETLE